MKKKRTIIILCIILLLAAVFCLTAFRVRGSVSVNGEGSTQSPDPVFFSQKDTLWAGDLLGDSSFTMETSGCLTACLAAELRMQDISIPEINAMDPGTLNSFFSGKQVYDREGNIQWDPLSSALNVSLERINGISAMRKTDLTALLSEGIYPIVRVRVKGLGNFHYVLLVKCQDGQFWCMDPLHAEEELVPLSAFGNRIYAIRYLYRP